MNFIKNPNYFKFLSKEQKDALFNNIEEKLQGKYKNISDAVISKDTKTLEMMSEQEQLKISEEIEKGKMHNILERGIPNATLAETLSRNSVQIKQDDSATHALEYINLEKAKEQQQGKTQIFSKKRKILLDAYQNVTLTDLRNAKGVLREGIEQPEKNYEGKEL